MLLLIHKYLPILFILFPLLIPLVLLILLINTNVLILVLTYILYPCIQEFYKITLVAVSRFLAMTAQCALCAVHINTSIDLNICIQLCRIDKEYDKEYSKCFSRFDVKDHLFAMEFWKPQQSERRNYMIIYQSLKKLIINDNGVQKLNCTNEPYNLDKLCFDMGEKQQTCNFTRIDNKNDTVELNPT